MSVVWCVLRSDTVLAPPMVQTPHLSSSGLVFLHQFSVLHPFTKRGRVVRGQGDPTSWRVGFRTQREPCLLQQPNPEAGGNPESSCEGFPGSPGNPIAPLPTHT